LEDKNIDVRFTTTIIEIKPDTELLIEVHVGELAPDQHLTLSQQLAELFGFQRRHFYLGATTARQTCKESTFKALVPNGSTVELELVTFPRGEGSQENIFVDNIYESLYAYIYKPKENLDVFVSHINTKLEKNGHDLKFLLREDGKTLMDFKSYAKKTGESVTLATEVAEIFGFVETKFAVGIHTSDRVASEDAMKKLKHGKKCYFYFGLYSRLVFFMYEPASRDADVVIEGINSTFKTQKFNEFDITFKIEGGELFVRQLPPHVTIFLPPTLNKFFGIPEKARFQDDTRFTLSSEIVAEEIEENIKDYTNGFYFPMHNAGIAK
ncbi:unnamed protein product, partial [Allacma fusca]